MKKLSIIVALFIAIAANAGEFIRYQNQWTTIYTNVLVSSNFLATATNAAVTFTNSQNCGYSQSHTLQFFFTATGTNSLSAVLDSTIDGVNWVPENTNTVAASASTGTLTSQFTLTGKRAQIRLRTTEVSTNGSWTVNYMAQ